MTTIEEIKERHRARIKRCSSCKAEIIWFKTKAGKWMPINASTVMASDDKVNLHTMIAHWATCPNANKHRRKIPGETSRARR